MGIEIEYPLGCASSGDTVFRDRHSLYGTLAECDCIEIVEAPSDYIQITMDSCARWWNNIFVSSFKKHL